MEAQNSIIVGALEFIWNGQSMTVKSFDETNELTGQEAYDLLCWLHDEQRHNLYRASHTQEESTNEE